MLFCEVHMGIAFLYQVKRPWVIFILTVLHIGIMSDAQSLSLVNDTVLPLKGYSFGMSCILSVTFTSNGISLLRNGTSLVSCTVSRGCSFIEGYTFKVNQTGVFMTISSLDRDSHEGSWTCTYAGSITSNTVNLVVYDPASITLVKDTVLPVKGSSFGMACILSVSFNSNGITLLRNGNTLVSCTPRGCAFGNWYTYKVNQTGVFITISSLDRDSHEGNWTCTYATNYTNNIISNPVNLYVYALPTGINFIQEPSDNVDLSMISATFQCRTIGCSYPDPVIRWMYENQNFSTGVQTSASDSCTSEEKIYTSTLFIQRNSTLSDNSDKTVIFSCRTDYPDPSINIRANATKSVRFAVRVTEAVLQQNNQNITEILSVNLGEPITLTCMTGLSRPDPTIDWYIGSQKRGNGPSLNFTPSNADHEVIIYCQAYNIDPNRIVYSLKPRLSVQVRVTEAVLQDNNQNITDMLNVTSGLSVSLICMTGTSRPAATITWYIGLKWKGNGTSLTFVPSNADHNEMIYCQAYNTDPGQPVFSLKPKLYVKVNVTGVGLSSEGTIFFYEGFPRLLHCTSSPSRPIPTIRWWLEKKQLTDKITNLDIMDTNNLYTRTSEINLTVTRDSRNKNIFCDGFINGQVTPAVSLPGPIDVLYAPDVNVTVTSSTQGNMSVTLRCDVHGNPTQYTFYPWKQVWKDVMIRLDLKGITTSNTDPAHNTLMLESMSLQDMGTYICSADNMIKGMNGMVIQSGAVDLKITGIPNIIKEEIDHFQEELGHSINISIPYYSYPAIKDFVFQRNGTAVMNTSRTKMHLSTATVDSEFYGKPVLLEVQVAHLFIQNLTMDDFNSYTLMLENPLGIKMFKVQLDAAVMPMKPINFHVTDIQEKQLSLRWQSGNQRGDNETFVVEISINKITWTNVSQVSSGNRDGWFSTVAGDLVPGSEYYLRLYAYNINGRGDFADVQLAVRTLKESAVSASVGINVGGAVGIGVGGTVLGFIAAIVAFTIRTNLNGLKSSCFRSTGKTDDETHAYSNTEMNPQTVRPIYEELNKGNAEQNVYDKISPL